MPLDRQRDSLCAVLHTGLFKNVAEVRMLQQMASWIFVRNIEFPWPDLGAKFNTWIAQYQ
jgi:hypothetical protein